MPHFVDWKIEAQRDLKFWPSHTANVRAKLEPTHSVTRAPGILYNEYDREMSNVLNRQSTSGIREGFTEEVTFILGLQFES